MKLLFALLMFPLSLSFGTDSDLSAISFETYDYDQALDVALEENKLIFINFNAHDVEPCSIMDKTTFKNQEVVNLMNTHFVNINANLDMPSGRQWINKFNVDCLPTFMILDNIGRLEGMNQGTLSSPAFLNWINSLRAIEQRTTETPAMVLVADETKIEIISKLPENMSTETRINEKEIREIRETKKREKANLLEIKRKLRAAEGVYTKSNKVESVELTNTKENEVVNLTSYEPVKELDNAPIEKVRIPLKENLDNTSDTRTMSYSVQLGAFSNYANAKAQLEKSKNGLDDRYYIIEESKDGKRLFKLVVGTYATRGQAAKVLRQLKQKGYEGFLRRI